VKDTGDDVNASGCFNIIFHYVIVSLIAYWIGRACFH